ncbi:MAG: hypothetical protein QOH59_233 [Gemmatimonadales bacterium]|jgi:hypothetical protein|nr:hypothetical protein [Gemmatimonadales bacterium]
MGHHLEAKSLGPSKKLLHVIPINYEHVPSYVPPSGGPLIGESPPAWAALLQMS